MHCRRVILQPPRIALWDRGCLNFENRRQRYQKRFIFGRRNTSQPSATAADIQKETLPSTPCLIVQGETLSTDKWMMSMEGTVVMGPHDRLLNGVAATFAAYYVFNLQYPNDASSTLEFIQRAFCGINSQTGSKAEKRHGLNAPVCTLLRKLLDFELMG